MIAIHHLDCLELETPYGKGAGHCLAIEAGDNAI